jgi:putative chitinase
MPIDCPTLWQRADTIPAQPLPPPVTSANSTVPIAAEPLPANIPRPTPRPANLGSSAPETSLRPEARPTTAPTDAANAQGTSETEDVCEKCQVCELITPEMLKKIFTSAPQSRLQIVADGANYNINTGKIDTEKRLTHFFGQVRQETGANLAFRESLNYSSDGLFNSKFSYYRNNRERSDRDARNEEAIANNAYDDANRGANYKLGNVNPGDGWRYRGRGLKQLTGRANYRDFTVKHKEIWGEDVDFEANPEKVDEPKYAVRSGLYFWVKNKLYNSADAGVSQTVTDNITRVINRATDSYAARWGFVSAIWSDHIFKKVCFNTQPDTVNMKAMVPYGSTKIIGAQ